MNTINEAAQILDKTQPTVTPPHTNEGGAIKDEGIPPATEKVSGKLEMLIRREHQALQRERSAKQKEQEIEAKLQALLEKEKRIEEFEGAKGNSKKAMELLGLNYDELTKSHLQDGEIPPEVQIKKIEEKFDAFKTAKEKEDQERAEEQKKILADQEQRAVANFKSEISTYVKDNSARYEFISFESAEDLVFDVIDEQYNRTQKVMLIKDAADKVELWLEQKEIKKKELSKSKALWGAVPKASVQEAVKQQTSKPQQTRTLTNQLSAKATPPAQGNRFLTDEERVQKALAYAANLKR